MEHSIAISENEDNKIKSLTNFNYYVFLIQSLMYGTVVGLNSMLIPIYALNLGANAFMVGLIAGSRGIGHFAFVVPIGFILERFGSKKVFLVSSFIDFFVIFLMGFVRDQYSLLFLGAFEGILCSTRLTALNSAFLSHLSTINQLKSGWFKGFMNSGLTLSAPVIGGILTSKLGFKESFIATALLVIATNIVVIIFGANYNNDASKNKNNLKKYKNDLKESEESFFYLLKNPKVLFTSICEGLGSGYMSSFRTLIILLIVGILHRSTEDVSLIVLITGVANIFIVFAGPPVFNGLSINSIFNISTSIMIPSLFILAFGNNLATLCIGSFFSGIGTGILSLGNYRMMAQIKGSNGKVAGLLTFSAGFSLAAAPMISSFIADIINVHISFLSYIIPFGLIAYLAASRRKITMI
ncbi:MAG TPA: MFS transporter [Clostridia bacterium]